MKKQLSKILLLLLLFSFPFATKAQEVKIPNLVKTRNSSAIYWIQANNKRLVFPSDKIFQNHFTDFGKVKLISFEELKLFPLVGNVKLKTNSLVSFGENPKVYQVKDNNELEWIKTEKGFNSLKLDFKNVINLPEILFGDYLTREVNGAYDEVLDEIKNSFIDQEKVKDLADIAGSTKGLIEALGDEYSEFWTKKEYEEFTEMLDNNSFEGIGAQIEVLENQLQVVTPLKGSPAESAGLEAGDKIMFIDDKNTASITVSEAVSLIRGPKGTSVLLKIKRNGNTNLLPMTITRGTIVVKHFSWQTKNTLANKKIGYLTLSQFSQTARQDLIAEKENILAEKYDGMILDLRNNPGGYLHVATGIASKWLSPDELILKEKRSNLTISHLANNDNEFAGMPLVILVNKGSASASEILAGALQDHKVATIIGVQTFGKGVVQEIKPLENGNVIKLTVSEWLTPNENKINKIGITPDILVEADKDKKNDNQLTKALEELDNMIGQK